MEGISFAYLLFGLANNTIWTAYAQKLGDVDLAIISIFGVLCAIGFLAMYLHTTKGQP